MCGQPAEPAGRPCHNRSRQRPDRSGSRGVSWIEEIYRPAAGRCDIRGEKCSDRRWRRSEWLLCEIEAVRHVVGRPVTSVNGLETEGLFAEPDDADMRVLDV